MHGYTNQSKFPFWLVVNVMKGVVKSGRNGACREDARMLAAAGRESIARISEMGLESGDG